MEQLAVNEAPISEREAERLEVIWSVLPDGCATALEIGARDGLVTDLLCRKFRHVTALDLERPRFVMPHVTTVAGDAQNLHFPDNSFDCVIATEVLEHIPRLADACDELKRVSKRFIVIGVPYLQDLRVGRLTCSACGTVNPAWGHLNSFDEEKLESLFSPLTPIRTEFTGSWKSKTSALATTLMDLGGNPWGSYDQREGCIDCGAKMSPPSSLSYIQRAFCKLAVKLNNYQNSFAVASPTWVHMLFENTADENR